MAFLWIVHTCISVIYDEIKDDRLRACFSPLQLPAKSQPRVVLQPEPSTSTLPRQSAPRCHQKDKDDDEPLADFVARHKKSQKEKLQNKGTGLQTMLTEYFQKTKKSIKKEKPEATVTQTPRDVLENKGLWREEQTLPPIGIEPRTFFMIYSDAFLIVMNLTVACQAIFSCWIYFALPCVSLCWLCKGQGKYFVSCPSSKIDRCLSLIHDPPPKQQYWIL